MNVPSTVETAIADRPVTDAVCLEAGAGVGNATAGLLGAGARRVYAITNDRDHAGTVRERIGRKATARDRLVVVAGDLRSIPLPDDSVEVITAHGLFNVVPTADLGAIATELTRVAAPGAHFVLDDYDPLPAGAAIRELFAVENAAAELAEGRPALTFYPAGVLRRLFEGYGWTFDRERTLLDPVPWTERHVRAHADAATAFAGSVDGDLGDRLAEAAADLADAIGEASTGRMYSLAFRFSRREERGQ